MRKIISFTALALVFCLGLSGCGEKKTANVKRESYESSEIQFTAPQDGDPSAIFDTRRRSTRTRPTWRCKTSPVLPSRATMTGCPSTG